MQHYYKSEDLEQKALEAIKKHNLYFITDVAVYLPVSRATFYNRGLDKLDSIKNALEANVINTKAKMRKKWYESNNATLQVSLMKLICSDDERKKLSMAYNETSLDANIKGEVTAIFTNDTTKEGDNHSLATTTETT